MNIKEISDLVNIRNYIASSINNHSIKRDLVNQLNTSLILMDKMLVEHLTSDEFKLIINYKNAEDAIKEVVKINNIKHNMSPSSKVVTIEDGDVKVK